MKHRIRLTDNFGLSKIENVVYYEPTPRHWRVAELPNRMTATLAMLDRRIPADQRAFECKDFRKTGEYENINGEVVIWDYEEA